jgi:hypothetical protein
MSINSPLNNENLFFEYIGSSHFFYDSISILNSFTIVMYILKIKVRIKRLEKLKTPCAKKKKIDLP